MNALLERQRLAENDSVRTSGLFGIRKVIEKNLSLQMELEQTNPLAKT